MNMLPINNSSLDNWIIARSRLTEIVSSNPLIHKNTWHTINDLGLEVNQHQKTLTIKFEFIQQDWLRLLAKFYVLVRSSRKIAATSIRNSIHHLNKFSIFINQKSVFSAEQINDELFDEFEYYLLHSLKLSLKSISLYYTTLTTFFTLCREEGWLNVNTYWFKGKYNRSSFINNDEINYIPEEVSQQLDEHLHHLPEPIQRMVIIIRGTGLRIGELLNLPFNCLRYRNKQWRLRFMTEKYKVVDEIPICDELVVVVKEQQKYIRQHLGDEYNNLFNSNDGTRYYTPAPRIMKLDGFNRWLNKLAKDQCIQTRKGEIWHFKSHQFRRTFATVLTNAGVRDLIIQKYLRHRSRDMQDSYKCISKEVITGELQELMKTTNFIDITGEIVKTHKPQNLVNEVMRQKMYQITTQHGECHRKILKDPCQTVNACWRCEHWLTSTDDLTALKEDFNRIEAELDIAMKLGMTRQQQGLVTDKQLLAIRIKGLENIND